MATQLATSTSNAGLGYSPTEKVAVLCDGSLVVADYDGSTGHVYQVTSPTSSPSTTSITTFNSGATPTIMSLFVQNSGTTSSDVWVLYSSNSATTGDLYVAHATYTASGSSWSWDNSGTKVTSSAQFIVGSIVWTGAYLIIAYRYDTSSTTVKANATTTKNGSSGWGTEYQLAGATGSQTHGYAALLHDATNSCTIAVYTQPTGTAGQDTVRARVIADGSAPTAQANWSTEATLSGNINVGAANLTAVLDPANKNLHVAWCDSVTSPNPKYVVSTYTTSAITAGTSFSITGGSGTAATSPALALSTGSTPMVYLFWASAASGSASDISYVTISSPYASANVSSVTNQTNASASQNVFPQVPHNAQVSGYMPLIYNSGSASPYSLMLDTSIAVSPVPDSNSANVGATVTTPFATSVTSMPVNLPSVVSGDRLLAIVEVRNSGTWTIPTGWTQLISPIAAGGVGDFTVFYRDCDGTEGSTATWTASVATTASWQVLRITGHDSSSAPAYATANSGGTPGTNALPSLTPSWGAADTLWLAVMGTTASGTAITAPPTNYSFLASNSVSSGGSQANTGTAYRQLNTASEHPGAFTTGPDRWWVAATIAIKPAAASSMPHLVQKAGNTDTGTGTLSATFPYNTTAGNMLYAVVGSANAAANSNLGTLSDTNGNTWTKVIDNNTNQGNGTQIWVAYNCKASTTPPTVSISDGVYASGIAIGEVTNLATSSAFDQSVITDVTGTNPSSSSTSALSNASEFILAAVTAGTHNGGIYTLGTGYANLYAQNLGYVDFGVESQVVSSTSGVSASFGGGTAGVDNKIVVATFKAAGSSGTTLTSTQSATARIANTKTVTQSSVARIAQNLTTTRSAVARIAQIFTKTQSAVARVATNRSVTQSATAHITAAVTKSQAATARIAVRLTKSQPAVGRIANSLNKTQNAIARIANTPAKTQPATARIAANRTKTQTATSRIAVAATKTQAALGRISNTLTKTQSATATISTSSGKTTTQPATARIAKTLTSTQSAVARIAATFAKTQPATARLSQTKTLTQPATARIRQYLYFTQGAVARVIQNSTGTTTQSATARIAQRVSATQPGVARIQATQTKTQSATSRISTHRALTQPAVSRVAQTYTLLQTALSRMAATFARSQSATARLATQLSYPQAAHAAIAAAVSTTQRCTARIISVPSNVALTDAITLNPANGAIFLSPTAADCAITLAEPTAAIYLGGSQADTSITLAETDGSKAIEL